LFLGESFEECAAREVMEETGLDVDNIEFLTVTNHVFLEEVKLVYIVYIFMQTVVADPNKQPLNVELDKCDGWDWYGSWISENL
jgi:8-oxo-dGTP diphosphatase